MEEALSARIEEVAILVTLGDEEPYATAVGASGGRITYLAQEQPLGYGRALHCAREFVGAEPFLHLVGDHPYIAGGDQSCVRELVETSENENLYLSFL